MTKTAKKKDIAMEYALRKQGLLKEEEKPKPVVHYCGECAHGVEDKSQINRSFYNGEHFCVRCPYYEEGKYVRIKSEKACKHFREKQQK